jgi:hypothetical protein
MIFEKWMITMSKPDRTVLRAAILEVVENQLRDNTPPESKQTFERLVAEGHTREEARRLIGVVVACEIFEILKRGEVYNPDRFIAALKRLPKFPYK